MNICSPIPKHCAPFSDTGRVHNIFAIDCNKSSVNFTWSNVFRLQKTESRLAPHSRRDLISARSLSQPVTLTTWKRLLHQLYQVNIYTLLNTAHGWSGTMTQLRGLYAQTFFTFRTALIMWLEELSYNSCFSGKAIIITPPERVFVALGIQHTMRMHHIVISGLPGSTIIVHLIS